MLPQGDELLPPIQKCLNLFVVFGTAVVLTAETPSATVAAEKIPQIYPARAHSQQRCGDNPTHPITTAAFLMGFQKLNRYTYFILQN